MASNLTNQSRNVLSKKVMVKKEVFWIVLSSPSGCWVFEAILCDHSLISAIEFAYVQESLDNITLFSIITMMSFVLLFPVAYFTEGLKFTPAYLQSAVSILLNFNNFSKGSVFGSFFWYALFLILTTGATGIKCSADVNQVFSCSVVLPCISAGEAFCPMQYFQYFEVMGHTFLWRSQLLARLRASFVIVFCFYFQMHRCDLLL